MNIGRLVKGAAAATVRIDYFFEQMEGMVEGKKSGKMFDEIYGAAKENKSLAQGMQVLIEDTSKEVKKTSLPIQEFFTKLQNEGLISELMKEKELLGQIKTEMTLLQESTSQFKETAEKISLFSDELNTLILNINEGKGSVGQFLSNEELYKEVLDFVKDIKANPWKLFIRRRN